MEKAKDLIQPDSVPLNLNPKEEEQPLPEMNLRVESELQKEAQVVTKEKAELSKISDEVAETEQKIREPEL